MSAISPNTKLTKVAMYLKRQNMAIPQEKFYTIRLLGLIDNKTCTQLLHDRTGTLKRKFSTAPSQTVFNLSQNYDLTGYRVLGVIYKDEICSSTLFISEQLGIVNHVDSRIDLCGLSHIEMVTIGKAGTYISLSGVEDIPKVH